MLWASNELQGGVAEACKLGFVKREREREREIERERCLPEFDIGKFRPFAVPRQRCDC